MIKNQNKKRKVLLTFYQAKQNIYTNPIDHCGLTRAIVRLLNAEKHVHI